MRWMSKVQFNVIFSKSSLSVLLAISMMLTIGSCANPIDPTATPVMTAKAEDITLNDLHVRSMKAGEFLQERAYGDWTRFALARAGLLPSDHSYASYLAKQIKENGIAWESPTELIKIILTLQAIGIDPTDFVGLNLIERLATDVAELTPSTTSMIFSLIALDSGNYTLSDDTIAKKNQLMDDILQAHTSKSGWSYTSGEASSIDVTSMAITSLAPYYETNEKVKTVIDQAVNWLSEQQLVNGGFSEFGESSESVAQVIIALSSIQIDAQSPIFTKEQNLVQRLLNYQLPNGSFTHVIGKKQSNMSTDQALQALVAYELFSNKEGFLYYRINPVITVDITIEGPQAELASGKATTDNALEALRQLATESKLELNVKDSDYGPYVLSIEQIGEDGADGWSYAVNRLGKWIIPQIGMGEFKLFSTDHVYVYYGGTTKLIHEIVSTPEQLLIDKPFTLAIKQTEWDWNLNQEVISPAVNVLVQIGDQQVKTNEEGIASFIGISDAGEIEIKVTGYQENLAPLVVPYSSTLTFIAQ